MPQRSWPHDQASRGRLGHLGCAQRPGDPGFGDRLQRQARRRSCQPARADTYTFCCGNGIAQKLLASTRSGLFDLAL
jgi:hypothetical protein